MATPSTLPHLSLEAHKQSQLPTDLSLFIQAAQQLLESFDAPSSASESVWKQGKTHDGVHTFTRRKQPVSMVGGDAFWAARKSDHPDAHYDLFKVSPASHPS
jgi:hypothetical protein